MKVAAAYADETLNILRAELEIAERAYQQHLLATQLCKMHILKIRRNVERAARDVTWFPAHVSPAQIDDPDWHAPSAEVHFASPSPPHVPGNVISLLTEANPVSNIDVCR
jgi:hypothetical protein